MKLQCSRSKSSAMYPDKYDSECESIDMEEEIRVTVRTVMGQEFNFMVTLDTTVIDLKMAIFVNLMMHPDAQVGLFKMLVLTLIIKMDNKSMNRLFLDKLVLPQIQELKYQQRYAEISADCTIPIPLQPPNTCVPYLIFKSQQVKSVHYGLSL